MDWNPDGKTLVFANTGGSYASIFNLQTKESTKIKSISLAWKVCWSHDGSRALFGCSNGSLIIVDKSGNLVSQIQGNSNMPYSFKWSPDSQNLAISSGTRLLRLFSGEGNPGPIIGGQLGLIYGVTWSPDSQQLVTVDSELKIRFWNQDGSLKFTAKSDYKVSRSKNISWKTNGDELLSFPFILSSKDGSLIRKIKLPKNVTRGDRYGWGEAGSQIVFNAPGNLLYVLSSTDKVLHRYESQLHRIRVSNDGKKIANWGGTHCCNEPPSGCVVSQVIFSHFLDSNAN